MKYIYIYIYLVYGPICTPIAFAKTISLTKYITYVQYILQGVSTLLMYIIVTNVEFLVSENMNIYLFLFYFSMML